MAIKKMKMEEKFKKLEEDRALKAAAQSNPYLEKENNSSIVNDANQGEYEEDDYYESH